MSGQVSASVRVDSWVWAVRLTKTRSLAAAACRGGHVRVNGDKAKPAQAVRIGDEVRVRDGGVERIVVVRRLIVKRVGASVAAECFEDLTPKPVAPVEVPAAVIRERGAGRPTKRDRRVLDRLRGHGA
jgi:ribosome-associated heat shock protein Hsp15